MQSSWNSANWEVDQFQCILYRFAELDELILGISAIIEVDSYLLALSNDITDLFP